MRKHDNPISRREKVHQKTLGNLTVWDQYTVLHIIYNPHHLSYVMIRACISTQFKITFVNFGTREANRAFFGSIFGDWSRSGLSPEIGTLLQALNRPNWGPKCGSSPYFNLLILLRANINVFLDLLVSNRRTMRRFQPMKTQSRVWQ